MQEFPRVAAVRKSTSLRTLLGGKTSDQLVNQRVTADKGKFLARSSRGFFFHLQAEILALPHSGGDTSYKASLMLHRAGSNTTAVRSDLPLQVYRKATPRHHGQVKQRWTGSVFRAVCLQEGEFPLFGREMCPREAPLLPPSSPEEQVATA